jgi:peroxiredoxin
MTHLKIALCCLFVLPVVSLVRAQPQNTGLAGVRDAKDRSPAPAFRLADPSGMSVRLSDFRGKPVVLNLWATDCGGCRKELPTFVELSRTYQPKGLTVIGVSMDIMYEDLKTADEGWARVRPFIAAHGMRYQIVLDDGSVEKGFNVTSLPSTYVVDRAGGIAASYVGVAVDPANLEANIKAVLAER